MICSGRQVLNGMVDLKSHPTVPPRSAWKAELAEERHLWRAIHDPKLKVTERVVAFARWRGAVTRLDDLAIGPRPERFHTQG